MQSDLSKQINIGPDIESKLIAVGIDSFAMLETLGSKQAFLRLVKVDPNACINMLYSLEGAILGIPWHELLPEEKQDLKVFHKMIKKIPKNNSPKR